MNYKVVADSSSNMHTIQYKNFEMVPLKITNSEKEFIDTPTLDVKDMVEHLKNYKGKTTTSCPNANDWISAFEDADVVFAVTITSKLSGSYNSAVLAKQTYEEQYPNRQVYVIDSLTAGLELKLIVDRIYKCLNEGMNARSTYENVMNYHQHTHTIFSLSSVDNLAKNGRVSSVVAAAVGVLNLRIVGIANGGVLDPQHKVRGDRKAVKTMLADMEAQGYNGGKISLCHCFNEKTVELFKSLVLDKYPKAEIEVYPSGGLMSFYGEIEGIVVGYEG